MNNIDCARKKIRAVIAGSRVPEDPRHADNTLEWLLRLEPDAGEALQLAALAHDIDRAIEAVKVRRSNFDDYDAFKAAHARHGAELLRPVLTACGVVRNIVDEACRLVHELRDGAPEACRRTVLDNVPLHVSILAAARQSGESDSGLPG